MFSAQSLHAAPEHSNNTNSHINSTEMYICQPRAWRLVNYATKIPLSRLRDSFVTSTNFPKIIGWDTRCSDRKLLQRKLNLRISSSPANKDVERGLENENKALRTLSKRIGKPCFEINGYHTHKIFSFLASSPDGVTSDGDLIEIKCPRKFYSEAPREHFAQIQFDMYVCGADRCYYTQYVEGEIQTTIVEAETAFMHQHLRRLTEFFGVLDHLAGYRE